jgi:4-amino-4-deoxy-L-arabinose transferase-like glycosyltransferase
VIVAAAPFLLLGLGVAPFDDPGEGMHAEIARELRAGGNPFDLRLSGVRYVDKPPLLYALLAGAFRLGGESEAAARAVPALAALAAVGAVAWLGTRLLGPAAGLLAGGALLSSAGFFAYGRYVRPETLFVAALAWGFALALVGLLEDRRALVAAGLGCFGLAGLAKDPLGALGPPAAIGVALALGGRAWPLSRWLPWNGVVAGALLAFGWWGLVEAKTPGFTWYTVVDNHLLNVARVRHFPDEDVPLGASQFVAVALGGAAPWIVGATVATVGLVQRRAWREPRELPWVALAVWAIGVLALTTLSPFRLPHYGLPAYPAVALLAARGWLAAPGRGLLVAHALAFAALAAACAVVWAAGGEVFARSVLEVTDVATRKVGGAGQATALPPWPAIRPLLGAAAVTLGGAALALGALALPRGARGAWGPPAVALAAMLAVLPLVASGLAVVAVHRAVRPLALEVGRGAAPGDLLVHEGPLENSGALEWYAQRRPVIVDGRRSVLAFGATLDGGSEGMWEAERLRRAWEGDERVWLVSIRPPAGSLAPSLPGVRLVAAAGGRWLYVNR